MSFEYEACIEIDNGGNGTGRTSPFTRDDITDADETSLGWSVFKFKMESNLDTINIATIYDKTTKDSEDQHKFISNLFNNNCKGFFVPALVRSVFAYEVDEYSVFSFNGRNAPTALKSLSAEKKTESALEIFKNLLGIIADYKNSDICKVEYKPLRCICEDSIYLEKVADGENTYKVKILPITAPPEGCFAELGYGMFDGKLDVAVDLYSAAYIYFKLLYANGKHHTDDENDAMIEKCFHPLKDGRPSLADLLKYFNISDNSGPIVYSEPIGKQAKFGDTSREHISSSVKKEKKATSDNDPSALFKSFVVGKIKKSGVLNESLDKVAQKANQLKQQQQVPETDDTFGEKE